MQYNKAIDITRLETALATYTKAGAKLASQCSTFATRWAHKLTSSEAKLLQGCQDALATPQNASVDNVTDDGYAAERSESDSNSASSSPGPVTPQALAEEIVQWQRYTSPSVLPTAPALWLPKDRMAAAQRFPSSSSRSESPAPSMPGPSGNYHYTDNNSGAKSDAQPVLIPEASQSLPVRSPPRPKKRSRMSADSEDEEEKRRPSVRPKLELAPRRPYISPRRSPAPSPPPDRPRTSWDLKTPGTSEIVELPTPSKKDDPTENSRPPQQSVVLYTYYPIAMHWTPNQADASLSNNILPSASAHHLDLSVFAHPAGRITASVSETLPVERASKKRARNSAEGDDDGVDDADRRAHIRIKSERPADKETKFKSWYGISGRSLSASAKKTQNEIGSKLAAARARRAFITVPPLRKKASADAVMRRLRRDSFGEIPGLDSERAVSAPVTRRSERIKVKQASQP